MNASGVGRFQRIHARAQVAKLGLEVAEAAVDLHVRQADQKEWQGQVFCLVVCSDWHGERLPAISKPAGLGEMRFMERGCL